MSKLIYSGRVTPFGHVLRAWLLTAWMFPIVLVMAARADDVPRDIHAYFAYLPEAAFDHTTDGLDPDEHQVLLNKGQSENWRFTRVHSGKGVLTAIHPSSVVTLTVMELGPVVLQVHTQNEQVETISYWISPTRGGPLEPFEPRFALQAASAAHFDLFGELTNGNGQTVDPLSGVPSEVIEHVDALEECGKIEKDNARRKRLRCSDRSAIETELRAQYAGVPIAMAILDRAHMLLGQ